MERQADRQTDRQKVSRADGLIEKKRDRTTDTQSETGSWTDK